MAEAMWAYLSLGRKMPLPEGVGEAGKMIGKAIDSFMLQVTWGIRGRVQG